MILNSVVLLSLWRWPGLKQLHSLFVMEILCCFFGGGVFSASLHGEHLLIWCGSRPVLNQPLVALRRLLGQIVANFKPDLGQCQIPEFIAADAGDDTDETNRRIYITLNDWWPLIQATPSVNQCLNSFNHNCCQR